MDSTFSEDVAEHNRNRNTSATQSIKCNTTNYNINVACCGSAGGIGKNLFDVQTDVLDLVMRTFTTLFDIQQEQGKHFVPLATWETACLAYGLTREQFGVVKVYCDALHVYKEEDGALTLET
jgi:hypothetical protein